MLDIPCEPLNQVAWVRSGDTVAAVCAGQLLAEWQLHDEPPAHLDLDMGGRPVLLLATEGTESPQEQWQLWMLDARSGLVVGKYVGLADQPTSLALLRACDTSLREAVVAVGCESGVVYTFNVYVDVELAVHQQCTSGTVDTRGLQRIRPAFHFERSAVSCMVGYVVGAEGSDERLLAVGHENGALCITPWPPSAAAPSESGREVASLQLAGSISALCFCADEQNAAADEAPLSLWAATPGSITGVLTGVVPSGQLNKALSPVAQVTLPHGSLPETIATAWLRSVGDGAADASAVLIAVYSSSGPGDERTLQAELFDVKSAGPFTGGSGGSRTLPLVEAKCTEHAAEGYRVAFEGASAVRTVDDSLQVEVPLVLFTAPQPGTRGTAFERTVWLRTPALAFAAQLEALGPQAAFSDAVDAPEPSAELRARAENAVALVLGEERRREGGQNGQMANPVTQGMQEEEGEGLRPSERASLCVLEAALMLGRVSLVQDHIMAFVEDTGGGPGGTWALRQPSLVQRWARSAVEEELQALLQRRRTVGALDGSMETDDVVGWRAAELERMLLRLEGLRGTLDALVTRLGVEVAMSGTKEVQDACRVRLAPSRAAVEAVLVNCELALLICRLEIFALNDSAMSEFLAEPVANLVAKAKFRGKVFAQLQARSAVDDPAQGAEADVTAVAILRAQIADSPRMTAAGARQRLGRAFELLAYLYLCCAAAQHAASSGGAALSPGMVAALVRAAEDVSAAAGVPPEGPGVALLALLVDLAAAFASERAHGSRRPPQAEWDALHLTCEQACSPASAAAAVVASDPQLRLCLVNGLLICNVPELALRVLRTDCCDSKGSDGTAEDGLAMARLLALLDCGRWEEAYELQRRAQGSLRTALLKYLANAVLEGGYMHKLLSLPLSASEEPLVLQTLREKALEAATTAAAAAANGGPGHGGASSSVSRADAAPLTLLVCFLLRRRRVAQAHLEAVLAAEGAGLVEQGASPRDAATRVGGAALAGLLEGYLRLLPHGKAQAIAGGGAKLAAEAEAESALAWRSSGGVSGSDGSELREDNLGGDFMDLDGPTPRPRRARVAFDIPSSSSSAPADGWRAVTTPYPRDTSAGSTPAAKLLQSLFVQADMDESGEIDGEGEGYSGLRGAGGGGLRGAGGGGSGSAGAESLLGTIDFRTPLSRAGSSRTPLSVEEWPPRYSAMSVVTSAGRRVSAGTPWTRDSVVSGGAGATPVTGLGVRLDVASPTPVPPSRHGGHRGVVRFALDTEPAL